MVLLEKLIVSNLGKLLVHILSHVLPCYIFVSYFSNLHLILSSHQCLCLPSGPFPPEFRIKPLRLFFLPHACHILFDLITLTILEGWRKSRNCSLCNFLSLMLLLHFQEHVSSSAPYLGKPQLLSFC